MRKPSCCCDSKRAGSDVALKEKSDCLALQTRCNISASESVLVRVMLSLSSLHQQLKAYVPSHRGHPPACTNYNLLTTQRTPEDLASAITLDLYVYRCA